MKDERRKVGVIAAGVALGLMAYQAVKLAAKVILLMTVKAAEELQGLEALIG